MIYRHNRKKSRRFSEQSIDGHIARAYIAIPHKLKDATMKIEKGVPMPAPSDAIGRTHKYPWADMDVGDSVFFEAEGGSQSKPMSAARGYGARHKMKFASRTEGTGVRIWRVE